MYRIALGLFVAVCGFTCAQANAQSGKLTPEQFQLQFWQHLTKSRSAYKNWVQFPELREGESPHGAWLKVFLNSRARRDPSILPHGSILVAENYDEDKKKLLDITVMYRAPGYNAENYDWYWIKYNPNGTVARSASDKALAGKVQSCIDCHKPAADNDYVFLNDPKDDAKDEP